MHQHRSYKYLDIIGMVFVAVVIISNITASKVISILGFTVDGGTILFPLSYIFDDILTEVYGYKKSRRIIWTSIVCLILMSICISIVGHCPAARDWHDQESYDKILGSTWRIVFASITGTFFGEFTNSFVMAKMKIRDQGRNLWKRIFGSTLFGEGVDTILFCTIAFYGTMPNSVLWKIMMCNYIFKVSIEFCFTPLTYYVAGWLKKNEHEDFYDRQTNFNPFAV